jgi:nickel-dependent lactate racemase
MIYFQSGSETADLSSSDLRAGLFEALDRLGPRKRVLAIPPDFTRFPSRSGELTKGAYDYYGSALRDILPALGTHEAMTAVQIETMFPGVPPELFRVHDWRGGVKTIGTLNAALVSDLSGGVAAFDWPVQLDRLIVEGGHDLILSIGQVVPHEVMGMANYTKNLFVGCGGPESINKSHYIGALCGLENLMGVADTPPRRLLNHAWKAFASQLPVLWVQTVVAQDEKGALATRGLFISDDEEAFRLAADLSSRVNCTRLEEPIGKAVVYLDPSEFKSTWVGNKAIYRTRMALADGAELLVLAPGVSCFGEDHAFDDLIRKYGYRGTEATLAAVAEHEDLASSLAVAAHLIHGSSEGRFRITYCPGHLSKRDVESVGFGFRDLGEAMKAYDPGLLREGWNKLASGERIFFISNPALGLWASPRVTHAAEGQRGRGVS